MMRNFWAGWNEVLRPTLTDRKGGALFISTPKGFNHFYDLCSISDADWGHFHFTTYDNPHIPVEEIEDAKRQLPEDVFAQEYMADFRKQQGLVYKEFMRDRHIVDTEPEEGKVTEYIAGVDFGYTNPTAVIHIKKDMLGNWWITDEWYRTGQSEEQIADYVFSCKFNKVYADPESPSAINALNKKHVHVSEVVKNKDSVINGISQVRTLFKQGKIKIHRRCVNLIAELESYRYPDRKPDHNEPEMPVKENDHALDAMRYAIMTSNPIRHIDVRDRMNMYIERQRNLANNAR
jgi:PBSX family phage terminase large subunit